ncbi:universal stress protein [Desulforegula conservatrix]|uniref:universal stress protein n=1 Tax=Desulforegula conservatrix TaxID=153026 RepID=UPI0003F567C0|nr:universal stress protein [Desulforegula conservatrix]
MERILVSMGAGHGAWDAWNRAILLARRIGTDARVYALMIMPSGHGGNSLHDGEISIVRERFELQIELAKSEGIHVEYFITEGDYEEEVIRFAKSNRITLLVIESTEGSGRNNAKGGMNSLRRIIHRILCRVDLVTPLKIKQTGKGEKVKHGNSTASLPADSRKQR